jgi:hypothetical protein
MNQLAICERLRDLAARQVEAIEADALDTFGALSTEREALASRLKPLAEPSQRAAATRLLQQVLQLDTRARGLLSTQLEATRSEIGQLRQGQRAVRAYAGPASTQGIGAQA